MKSLMKVALSFGLIVALMAIVGAESVNALPTMIITDGSTSVMIEDNQAGDLSANVGEIIFSGAIGIFKTNIVTGVTKPAIEHPMYMDMTSINVSSTESGTLKILFSETGFDLSIPGIKTLVNGNTFGSSEVAFNSYLDESDVLFGTGTMLSDLGPYSESYFSASSWSAVSPAGPFSLTSIMSITHNGMANTVVGMKLVPEASTIIMMGCALIGLAVYRRRQMHR